MLTLVEVLKRTERHLAKNGVPKPRLDAELLLGHALGLNRVGVYLNHDRPLTEAELETIRPLVTRRARREPVAWIIGQWAFHAIDLQVHPGVLVPRSDTETLVEHALRYINDGQTHYIADLGCGSGAIGLALAHAAPAVRVYAVDLSPAALACTAENVAALGLEKRVAVLRGDLLAAIPPHRPIDIIVSNPPYIATEVLKGLAPEVAMHEPKLALDGGPDGLDCYRRLIPAAAQRARRAVLVEVGYDQGAAVRALFEAAGLEAVRVHLDLAGRDRVVEGRVPGAAPPVEVSAKEASSKKVRPRPVDPPGDPC